MTTQTPSPLASARLDYMDAVRAFALILGIVFHASLSFMPIAFGWAVMDVSTSWLVGAFIVVSHSFRMEVFFLIAGFFSHLTFHRSGATSFLRSRATRIVIPYLIGWLFLRPLIVSGWIMGFQSGAGEVQVFGALLEGFKSILALPAREWFVGSHLWFLYYLVLLTVLWLAGRQLAHLVGMREGLANAADKALARLSMSPFAVSLLALPTALVLWFMADWGMDTPDKSLVPHLPVTLVYGAFFGLGWVLHRAPDTLQRFSQMRLSLWLHTIFGIGLSLALVGMRNDPSHPHHATIRAVFGLGYAVMMWSLVFVCIGVFRRLVDRSIPCVRYVADSSYWMYLIHLPIVVWMQVAVASYSLHWTLKLAGITVLTLLISQITYDLFVRSTIIGRVLNGRRKARALFFRAD